MSVDLKAFAMTGAKARLAELAAERSAILREFPNLRTQPKEAAPVVVEQPTPTAATNGNGHAPYGSAQHRKKISRALKQHYRKNPHWASTPEGSAKMSIIMRDVRARKAARRHA